MDTGIAATAFFRTEPYFAVFIRKQGSFRAFSHTAPAIPAEGPGLRIVTVSASHLTALQKYHAPDSRTIYQSECFQRMNLSGDYGMFIHSQLHALVAGSGDHIHLLLSGQIDEFHCISGYTDSEVCVLLFLRMLHSVDQLLFTKYVYV